MPLSEDEERILSEIEEQLYETDPGLAREVAETTVYTYSLRHLKWSVLGFLVGLAAMVLSLSTSYVFAFGGFLVMMASGFALERSARHLGRTSLQQAAQSNRGSTLKNTLGDTRAKMRERFQRGEQGRR